MRVFQTLPEWLERRRELEDRTIGLVPTMGALHRGHASLVERSRKENDITVVSIFINPSQFNDAKDLDRYPRTLENDLELLSNLKADDVITPTAREMYPNGYDFQVHASSVDGLMEAGRRPGFLEGVMTIVLKLLNLVRANRAYFGEKDYQQLKTIAEMARDFFITTEIVGCPTVREPSGLAESSRNRLLSSAARERAAGIYRALTTARDSAEARAMLEAQGFSVEYVEEHWGRRFAAAVLDGVRLIDNVPLSAPSAG